MKHFWAALVVALAGSAQAADVTVDMAHDVSQAAGHAEHVVDQVTDPGASAARGMFQFEPSLLRLAPGDRMVVLNSTGEHTVHSVPALWPADKEEVAIANAPRSEVQFDAPGVYGLRCRRHGQYGMVMLVIVGDGGGVTDISTQVQAMKARPAEKKAFRDLFESYLNGQ